MNKDRKMEKNENESNLLKSVLSVIFILGWFSTHQKKKDDENKVFLCLISFFSFLDDISLIRETYGNIKTSCDRKN